MTGDCNPDTAPDACLNIDPATGIGQTFIGFVPCGPGVTAPPATDTPPSPPVRPTQPVPAPVVLPETE